MVTHYHDYERIGEDDSALVEICRECKKRLVTKKGPKGRIDNNAFYKEHVRDFAQPNGRNRKVFQRFHGKK